MTFVEILSLILAILSFALIFYIGITKDVLRSNGPSTPFSFHKVQAWLWTLVICPCFALNWGFLHEHIPTINKTAMILLGISFGTGLTGEIINAVHIGAPVPATGLKMLSQSKSFWIDILTGDDGQISIGRLQQFIFTILYVVIYLTIFFPCMRYPDFDDNAFILMGISTGTFLVSKGLHK
ncbi:hypothetical protein [Dyadobacter sp. BHUBP1]|uniref:hypothetical protein n=1 Tax=Dyadobacter sp. BHUBP1 TaxID=3424178 RepID=UPI003D3375A0